MSSRARRRANRQNAKHSTGPKTDPGKQRSSQNALKHGLRSKHPLIPGEDPAEYQRKLDILRADLRPLNALEDDIVEQTADTSWRLKRLSRIEAAVESYYIQKTANKEENTSKDDDEVLGDALNGYGRLGDLAILSRYEAQLTRRYHRLTKELRDLRKSREENCFRERSPEEREREEREFRERQQRQAADPPGEETQSIEPTQSTQPPMKPVTSDISATPSHNPAPGPNPDLNQPTAETPSHTGPKEAAK